ncbi:MAG: DUF4178 domain-containing protein [Calditrichaeota bacterium]|nr:DUF4178 domain-containing protein [Calditrichota bacterium]
MALFDFFKKKDKKEFDPLRDLTLEKLQVGYLVDYDMKTWEVTAHHRYDFGEGYTAEEWELTAGREKIYLEKSEDDDVEWTVSRKIPLGAIQEDVRSYIIEHDDPPHQITYKGKTYYLDESGAGYFYEDGKEPPIGFVYWDFIDEEDEHFVTIEQWGETEFEAAFGYYVEPYQFSNILPRSTTE